MKYRCKECKALLIVFRILNSTSLLDPNSGGVYGWEEEEGSEIEVKCSKNIDHNCGFICKHGIIQES